MNVNNLLHEVCESNWQSHQIKVYIWLNYFAKTDLLTEKGKEKELEKIHQSMGLSLPAFKSALEFFGRSLPSLEKTETKPEPTAINTDKLKGILNYWKLATEIPLSLNDKMMIYELYFSLGDNADSLFRHAIDNFANYHLAFGGVSNTERMQAYIMKKSIASFISNFHKYFVLDDAAFHEIVIEHQKRYDTFKNRPISYGYSNNPAEDKAMAREMELQSICLALEQDMEYKNPIHFPENMEYYQRKLKNKERRKKKDGNKR
jgi:hypothetical protein